MMASTDFLPVKETIEVLAFFEINPPGSDLPTGLDYLFISKDSEAVEGGNNLYFISLLFGTFNNCAIMCYEASGDLVFF